MKTRFNFLTLVLIPVFALFSFSPRYAAAIKGSLTPADYAGDVWAISGNVSSKVTPFQGTFRLNDLKPGTYKIVVEGRAPYKDYVREGVVIKDEEVLDLGNITLPR